MNTKSQSTTEESFTLQEQIDIHIPALRLMVEGLFSLSRSNLDISVLEGQGYILAFEQQLDELDNKLVRLSSSREGAN